LLFAAILTGGRAHADTTVPGGDIGAQTWTAAGSPYTLNDDVTASSLNVEAGVTVRLGPNVNISVTGAFVVAATPEAPSSFGAFTDAEDDRWGALEAGSIDVTGIVFRNSRLGLRAGSAASVCRIQRSAFELNAQAIVARCPSLSVDSVRFTGAGILLVGAGATVTNSVFVGGTTAISRVYDGPLVEFVNCTLADHSTAFGTSVTIRNTIVGGSWLSDLGDIITASHSIVNAQFTGGEFVEGDGMIYEQDPGFVAADNFHLASTSPAIDTGTATGAPDHDFDGRPRPSGARFDIGAFESPLAAGAGGTAGVDASGGTAGVDEAGGAAGESEAGGSGGIAPAGGTAGAMSGGAGGTGGGAAAAAGTGGMHGGTGGGAGAASTSGVGGAENGGAGSGGGASTRTRAGCGCRAGTRTPSGAHAMLALVALLAARRRRP